MPDLSFIRKPVSVEDVDGSGSESEEENVQNTSDFEQETSVEDSEILNEYTHIQTEVIPCGPPEPLNASAFVDSSDALMIQILEQEEGQMDIYENPEPLNTSAFPDNSKEEEQEHQYLQQVEQVDQCDAPGPVSTPALENDSEEFQIEHKDLQQKVQTDRDPYDVTQKI